MAISSRSAKERYRPVGSARQIGDMPPAWRNHRDPTGVDTPTTAAASSLESPSAISRQNARSTARGHEPRDRLERDFTAAAPDQRWVADITYVATWTGFVYVATLEWVDWYNNSRLHGHCGDIPLTELEDRYYADTTTAPATAATAQPALH